MHRAAFVGVSLVFMLGAACGDDTGTGGGGGGGAQGGGGSGVGGTPVVCLDWSEVRDWEIALSADAANAPSADAAIERVAVTPQGEAVLLVRVAVDEGQARFELGGIELALPSDATGARGTFVVKLGADGAALWATLLAGPGPGGHATRIASQQDGGVVVAGTFSSETFDAGETTLSQGNAAGQADAFVAALDEDGGVSWARNFNGASSDDDTVIDMPALATSAGGDVYFGVEFEGDLVIGAARLLGWSSALVKLEPGGAPAWTVPFAAKDTTGPRAIAALPGGSVRMIGGYDDAFTFEGIQVVKDPFLGDQVFFAELDLDGEAIRARPIQNPVGLSSDAHVPLALTPNHVLAFGIDSDVLEGTFAGKFEGEAFAFSFGLDATVEVAGAAEDSEGRLLVFGLGADATCGDGGGQPIVSRLSADGHEEVRSILDEAADSIPRGLGMTAENELIVVYDDRVIGTTAIP
jgi:hypothetical protein